MSSNVLKVMSNKEVAAALRLAMKYGTKPRVVEALWLEAFDRVLVTL